jgi:hypothetical protein
MAFYGDLFREKGTKSIGIPEYDENDLTDAFEQDLLEAFWVGGAQIDNNVSAPQAPTKIRTSSLVQRALYALSHSKFFANIAEKAFIFGLKQVKAYLTDDTIRRAATHRVEDAITNDTRVVVAHSLGTVVAYEALCAHPEWPVHTFVTLGSPLGIRMQLTVRQAFRNPRTAPQETLLLSKIPSAPSRL